MTERHTRQGTPRAEKRQMGDHLEDDEQDWAARKDTRGGSAQNLRVIAAGNCWCQGTLCTTDAKGNHHWPGKDQGKPHPRTEKR